MAPVVGKTKKNTKILFVAPKHIVQKMVMKINNNSQSTFINFEKRQFKTPQ